VRTPKSALTAFSTAWIAVLMLTVAIVNGIARMPSLIFAHRWAMPLGLSLTTEEEAAVEALPAAEREYVVAPPREAASWIAGLLAMGLAWSQHLEWHTMLQPGAATSPDLALWVLAAMMAVGLVAAAYAKRQVVRRARELRASLPEEEEVAPVEEET